MAPFLITCTFIMLHWLYFFCLNKDSIIIFVLKSEVRKQLCRSVVGRTENTLKKLEECGIKFNELHNYFYVKFPDHIIILHITIKYNVIYPESNNGKLLFVIIRLYQIRITKILQRNSIFLWSDKFTIFLSTIYYENCSNWFQRNCAH